MWRDAFLHRIGSIEHIACVSIILFPLMVISPFAASGCAVLLRH